MILAEFIPKKLSVVLTIFLVTTRLGISIDLKTQMQFEIDTMRGYICVRAYVNDYEEPEWFIFDTGATGLFLFYRAASRLGVSYDESTWVELSKDSTYPGGYTIPEIEVKIAGTTLRLKLINTAFVLPKEVEPILIAPANKLVRAAGILGVGAFKAAGLNLKISYTTKELIMSPQPFNLDGWMEVTAQAQSDLPFIRLRIGSEEGTALLDSGWYGGLVMPFSMHKRYRPNIPLETNSPPERRLLDVARLFLPVKIGDNSLNYELITITSRERPYLIVGALEMIFYDWIIDRENRVYLRRRKDAPKVHAHVPSPIFTNIEMFFDENLGILAGTVPGSRAARAGLTGECVVLSINGIRVPPPEIPPSASLAQELAYLLANPFTETVRLQVRCGEQEREVAFQLLPSDKIVAVLMHYFPIGITFRSDTEGKIEAEIDTGDFLCYYRVNGKPIEASSCEGLKSIKYTLIRVPGLPEDFTHEDFWDHLYSCFSRDEPVMLVCVDGSGREVELEVPPRQRMHDKLNSESNKDIPQSLKGTRDE